MPPLNHNLPNNRPNNSLNSKPTSNNLAQQNNVTSIAPGAPAVYPPTTYTANYVPSTYTNGILLPQQSTSVVAKGSPQADDQTQNATKSNQTNDSVGTTKASDSGSSPGNVQASSLPFARPNGKKIDVTDFENSSSPFDDALLRSIDDKEELSNIFQQFYNGAK